MKLSDLLSEDSFNWTCPKCAIRLSENSCYVCGTKLSIKQNLDIDDLRIVETPKGVSLSSLDDDGDIQGVELKLEEGCSLDFDKHMNAISSDEQDAINKSKKYYSANESLVEYDKRYKEKPKNRIKYKNETSK